MADYGLKIGVVTRRRAGGSGFRIPEGARYLFSAKGLG